MRAPAAALAAYGRLIHVPRPGIAVLLLAALGALVARTVHRREVLLLVGTGVALLVGTVAVGDFVVRYIAPTLPLLLVGGGAALGDLVRSRS